MKKSYKYFFYFFLIIVSLDLLWRQWFDDSQSKLYKSSHCLKSNLDVGLCPNINMSFKRTDGEIWDIKTNHLGERITDSCVRCEKEVKRVWILGDSMAMGYGLKSENTVAHLVHLENNVSVRTIAVDALGTLAIKRLFESSFSECKDNNKPQKIYWIWNPSDFIDDTKELNRPKFYSFIYPIHFFLAKRSYIYNLFFATKNPNQYDTNFIPIVYDTNHPTYSNVKIMIETVKKTEIPMVVLFAWGMHPTTGHPDTNDGNYEKMKSYLESLAVSQIDLRRQTEEAFFLQKKIYIPNDGHPDVDLSKLFANAITKDLKQHE
ncbi:hypothetical protein P3G55_19180 [Leptospira sp. 96542]|nr:hypothetical protein [Leptospira sp. 96542]